MLRALIRETAAALDGCRAEGPPEVSIGHQVSMSNYRANRLGCDAAAFCTGPHTRWQPSATLGAIGEAP